MMANLTEEQKEHAMVIFKRLLDGEPVKHTNWLGEEMPITPSRWNLDEFIKYAHRFYAPQPKKIGVPSLFWNMLDPKWKGVFIDSLGQLFAGANKPTERGIDMCHVGSLLDIRLFDIDDVEPETSWTPRPEKE